MQQSHVGCTGREEIGLGDVQSRVSSAILPRCNGPDRAEGQQLARHTFFVSNCGVMIRAMGPSAHGLLVVTGV